MNIFWIWFMSWTGVVVRITDYSFKYSHLQWYFIFMGKIESLNMPSNQKLIESVPSFDTSCPHCCLLKFCLKFPFEFQAAFKSLHFSRHLKSIRKHITSVIRFLYVLIHTEFLFGIYLFLSTIGFCKFFHHCDCYHHPQIWSFSPP